MYRRDQCHPNRGEKTRYPDHFLDSVCPRWAAFAGGLALNEAPLRDRLRDEYAVTLDPVIDRTIKLLPDRLAIELTELDSRLRAIPHEVDGSIAASICAMDDDDVREISDRLLEIGHVVGANATRVYDD